MDGAALQKWFAHAVRVEGEGDFSLPDGDEKCQWRKVRAKWEPTSQPRRVKVKIGKKRARVSWRQ